MVPHKCICQICTCGRHRCPSDKHHTTSIGADSSENTGSSIYLEEFSPKKADRSVPVKQAGNLEVLKGTPFQKCSVSKEMYRAYENEEAKQSRQKPTKKVDNLRRGSGKIDVLTTHKKEFQKYENIHHQSGGSSSSCPWQTRSRSDLNEETMRNRRRARESQVQQNFATGSSSASKSTVYRQNFPENSTKNERVQAVRPKNQYEPPTGSISNYSTEHKDQFITTKGDRYATRKPVDQLIKSKDQFQTTTSQIDDFRPGLKAERYEMKLPRDSLGKNAGPMDKTTFYEQSFQPKSVAYSKAMKPKDTHRRPSGSFDGATVNRQTYVEGKGERWPVKKPINNLTLASPDDHFDGTTVNHHTYTDAKGDRMPVKIPADNIEQSTDPMDYRTVQRETFLGANAERAIPKKPVDSYPKAEGKMSSNTAQNESYITTKGDRLPVKIPKDNIERLQGNFESRTEQRDQYNIKESVGKLKSIKPKEQYDKPEGPFDARTVHMMEFKEGKGDRADVVKHADHFTKFVGTFDDITTQQQDFHGLQGERMQPVRPTETFSKPEGKFNGSTVHREVFKEGKGDRMPIVIPADCLTIHEGNLDFTTVHNSTFTECKGERADVKKPADNIQKLEGQFDGRTVQKDQYAGAFGERSTPVYPVDTLIKHDGPFEGLTVNQETFTGAKGDRMPMVKHHDSVQKHNGPIDSLTVHNATYKGIILDDRPIPKTPMNNVMALGDHNAQMETTTAQKESYKAGKGERMPVVHHYDTDILKSNESFDSSTVHKEAFKAFDQQEKIQAKRPEHQISKAEGPFDSTTTQRDNFKGVTVEKSAPMKPKENHVSFYGNFDARTTHREEFKESSSEKLAPFLPKANYMKNDGPFDASTVYGETYQNVLSHVDRSTPVRPQDTFPKIGGSFDALTVHNATYVEGKGERADVRIPKDNLHLESGKFNSNTIHKDAFRPYTAIEKVNTKRPVDNNTLKNNGNFEGTTMYKQNFQYDSNGITTKLSPARPRHNLNVNCHDNFQGNTVNKDIYRQYIGDRYDTKKPVDNLVTSTSKMSMSTSYHDSFPDLNEKGRNSRAISAHPTVGRLSADSLISTGMSMNHANNGINYERVRPVLPVPQIFRNEGSMETSTVYSKEYSSKSSDPCIAGRLLLDNASDNSGPRNFKFSHEDHRGHKYFSPV